MKECTTHHNACACREAKYTSDMALLRAELKRTAAQLEHWRALAHSRAGLEAQYGRMRQVLELIAAPKRKDSK